MGESRGVQKVCRKSSGWSSGTWVQVLAWPRAPKSPQVSNLPLSASVDLPVQLVGRTDCLIFRLSSSSMYKLWGDGNGAKELNLVSLWSATFFFF